MPVDNETAIERCAVMKQITAKRCTQIHPCLPVQRGNVRVSKIIFIDTLPYVLENGCKRGALPKRFGNWFAVYAGLAAGSAAA